VYKHNCNIESYVGQTNRREGSGKKIEIKAGNVRRELELKKNKWKQWRKKGQYYVPFVCGGKAPTI
jgi:hypothetical protein